MVKWLFVSKEVTNFTYDLEANNKRYLASLISDILNVHFDTVMGYIAEIEEDEELMRHIINVTVNSDASYVADTDIRYGRRVGWYAFVRALKPKVVVETGVDKGLGSCVITAALMRNSQEGCPGRYYGTDINDHAGYLLSGVYADHGTILYGDSQESLLKFKQEIDLFINDSDHSAEYETEEYEVVADKLSKTAIVLGDNSHTTDKLLDFSIKRNRNFVFFKESPESHWYPGAGIGISFVR